MKKFRLLVCMLALGSLALFTACDDDDDDGRRRPGNTDTNEAPASLSGRTMNVVIFSGTAPFDANGTYNIRFDTDTAHTLQDDAGQTVSSGNYVYTQGANDDANIVFTDSRGTVTSALFFDTPVSGRIDSTEAGGGEESSDFTLQ